MSVILYHSGITEDFSSKEFTFTDDEILSIFNDFQYIRTSRLYEVPNTWCVWGENEENNDSDFNKLGSDIVQETIFSAIMFIHDTELDPAWLLTDDVILKGYDEFKEELLMFFDHIAEDVIKQGERIRKEQGIPENLLFLSMIGPTEDKRIMFEFNPHKQSNEFWKVKTFSYFAFNVFTFLKENYKNEMKFTISADKKSIILVSDENVEFIMNKIIDDFKRLEHYEKCSDLNMILNKWKKFKKKKSKNKDEK